MNNHFETIRRCVEEERPLVAATIISGPRQVGARLLVFADGATEGSLADPALEGRIRGDALAALERGAPRQTSYPDADGEPIQVFLDVYPPPPTLLIFGGVHIGVPLARFAKQMGFRVRVIDARGRFANTERFPDADEIVISYADEYLESARVDSSTYVVVLSHDPKLDDPALLHVLRTPARYIGAIGSKTTNEKRRARLKEQGLSDELIARIHAPIGLNIGAETPDEIALAIMGEMVAAKNGIDARPLPDSSSESAPDQRTPLATRARGASLQV